MAKNNFPIAWKFGLDELVTSDDLLSENKYTLIISLSYLENF